MGKNNIQNGMIYHQILQVILVKSKHIYAQHGLKYPKKCFKIDIYKYIIY